MIFFAIIFICSIIFFTSSVTRPYICMVLIVTFFCIPRQVQPVNHYCDVMIHENLLETHVSWKQIKGVVCKWDSKSDLLSHVAGADKPLLIIAHGKGVLGESFIGKRSDPVTYSEIGEYKVDDVGIASCRGKETNISPRPFKENGLWVFVNHGEALVSSSIEIYNKWKERGSK